MKTIQELINWLKRSKTTMFDLDIGLEGDHIL